MLLLPINTTSLFIYYCSSIAYISIDNKILELGNRDKKIYYSLLSTWGKIAINKIIEDPQTIDLHQREITMRNKTISILPLRVIPEPLPNSICEMIAK